MKKITGLFLYGGLTKEEYKEVLPLVREDNRKNLFVFSLLAFAAFLVAMYLQYHSASGIGTVCMAIFTVVFLALAILSDFVMKNWLPLTDVGTYLYVIILLVGGIYAGVSQPNERTTLLLAFYVLAAVLFCGRILCYTVLLVITEIIYLILISTTQTGDQFTINYTNSIIFCAVGVFSAIYLMNMKYKKYNADYNNQFLVERDPLTSLLNRRSYELELARIKTEKIPVAICVFDINGLKETNDEYGHAAGDELIKGAADCISAAFGAYGKIFRVGGDEFIGILEKDYKGYAKMVFEFKRIQDEWHGKLIDHIGVSCGIAIIERDFDTMLSETLKKADMLMYEEKQKYYESKEVKSE